MEKVNDILINVLATLQVLMNNLLNLVFQPLFCIISIIQGIIEVWKSAENTNDTNATETNDSPVVMQYPSTNESYCVGEIDYPIGNERHIGFRINTDEQQQIDEIRRQLNKQ